MSVRSVLEARLREQERNLKNYKKRLEELQNVIGNLAHCDGDGYEETKIRINDTKKELQLAVSRFYIHQCIDELTYSTGRVLGDSNIGDAMNELHIELRNVDAKISNIESNIRFLRRRIAEAIEAERQK